jgi:aspartate aminotransferase/aminotransferase
VLTVKKIQSTPLKPPAHGVGAMRRSGIREVMDLAASHPGVIHLEVGEPDFATPAHIIEAAARAGEEGYTKYTANRGLLSLREALAAKLARLNRISAGPEEIVVTTGGVTALVESLFALVEPGEEILLPDPGWPNYEMMAAALSAHAVRYPLDRDRCYEPDLGRLAELAGSPRAKVIVVNSPGNPTGSVWSRETVERVYEIACERNTYLLTDEVYEEILFDGEHVSPASFDDEGRVVSAFSFSKTYAMTGWRVGYVVSSPPLAEVIAKVQEAFVSCCASVSQMAAQAALLGPQECVAEMRDAYSARRDLAVAALREHGLFVTEPRGAFYILGDVSAATSDTFGLARHLVVEHGVAVAPGETFGPAGAGLVRLSLAASASSLEEGIRRLAEGVQAWPRRQSP